MSGAAGRLAVCSRAVLEEHVMRRAWEAGRAAWPEIELARDAFDAYAGKLDARAADRFPEDIYLAAACLAGDATALATFDRDLLATARGAIRSIDANDAFVDEACQRLRANLLVGDGARPRIADFAARGPLRAWVGVAAVRTALMLRRSQVRAREVPLDDTPEGDSDWTRALITIS